MAKGITIDSGSPRTLSLEGVQVTQGGSANQAGLYAAGSKLFLDGEEVADASGTTGLLISDGELTFNGEAVGDDTPPTPPSPSFGLWLPPTQEESRKNAYNYEQYIGLYDALMTSSAYPGTITKFEYKETQDGTTTLNYGSSSHTIPNIVSSFEQKASGAFNAGNGSADHGVPQYHYEFTPANYTKTYVIQAGIHGNEHDAPQTLYRIMDIICNHANESAYSRLAQLRDNVRFIVIPVASPWAHDVNGDGRLDIPYTDWDGRTTKVVNGTTYNRTVNPNRQFDFVHGFNLGSSSADGGNYPFQFAEVRHIKAIVDRIEPKNIDYMFDFHDGGGVKEHFWFNYNMDGANAAMANQLLTDIIAEEERLRLAGGTDYRHSESADADKLGYVYPNVRDANGYSSGITAGWANSTLGILGSVIEYLGGYFHYGFGSEQMTRSLRFRANIIIYAYELLNTKGWLINESADADYFHFDYPIAMTRQGMRQDDSQQPDGSLKYDDVDVIQTYNRTTFGQVYQRWDALAANYPGYVTKSSKLGENYGGASIYSYTLGSGAKKVLFIGGPMRWSSTHKETEYGIYVLAEYLCNDYIVNQSAFLTRLKQDYTIVVLPCIDINSGNNSEGAAGRNRSLNTYGMGSYKRWQVSNGICVKASESFADANIFKAWVDSHSTALVLVSGGEDSPSSLEDVAYETSYMTQFILPKNMDEPQWLIAYRNHLKNDRGENAPVVEYTKGNTSGDYAFDNRSIKTVYVNLKVSNKWAEREHYTVEGFNSANYMYRNYETGRRIANIVNIFLMAGGDIAAGGGLVNKND